MRRSLCILAFLVAPLFLAPSASAGGIPVKTLKQLKASSVYIKVQLKDAVGPLPVTGSGFLVHVDGTTAFIATNSHVVTPRFGEVRIGNPQVVFSSGTPTEKTVDAEIVASDPARDLAVLKVVGVKDLPPAIPIDPSIDVVETMTVFAFGYPFGKDLALDKGNPAITITKGTVSSLRNDHKGAVKLVQIDAEINPGNSGGPVVDDKGNLVGVAVSKLMKARTVGFAVPLPMLTDILNGKVSAVAFDTLRVEKGKAQVDVDALLLDPQAKVRDIVVRFRGAEDLKDLPPADKEGAKPVLKDAIAVPLKMEKAKGRGSFAYAEDGKDKRPIAFEVQYVNAAGKTVVTPPARAAIDFTQVIHSATLTRTDPIDKTHGKPHKLFTHKMKAGKHYVIEMRGDPKEVDPWLIVRDPKGNILAEDDDSGGLLNAMVVVSPPKDDEYQIVATVFKDGALGPFTLRIREEAGRDTSKGFGTAGTLAPTDPSDPLMEGPAQSFNLILKKGKSYTVDMKSKLFDPYLRIENMAGLSLKTEDLGGDGHSTLFFNPVQDGIYRLVATTYDYKTGAYDLKLVEAPPRKQHDIGPDGLKLADALTATDPLDIELGKVSRYRCKVFEVKMKRGQKVQIELNSTGFDPVLRVEDLGGKELAFEHPPGAARSQARLTFAPPADGVYRVIASHFDGRFGKFDLSLRVSP